MSINFDIELLTIIDKKYDFQKFINPREENTNNYTDISKIIKNVSYFDDIKQLHNCNLTMIDYTTSKEMSNLSNFNCFWCRHNIDSFGIGCPIKYIPPQITKCYNSEINKNDSYTIKENITTEKYDTIDCTTNNIICKRREYYEVDGIFCSFNCCLAWIEDNKNNKLYMHSKNLLYKMLNQLNEKKFEKIIPAPNWRLLKEYGGHLSYDEYKSKFNKVSYTNRGIYYKPIGNLFEERISF